MKRLWLLLALLPLSVMAQNNAPFSPLGSTLTLTAPNGSSSASTALPGQGGYSIQVIDAGTSPITVAWSATSGGATATSGSLTVAAGATALYSIPYNTVDVAVYGLGASSTTYLTRGSGGGGGGAGSFSISGSVTAGDCTKLLSQTTGADSGGPCGGSGSPGGSSGQLQYNNAGSFGGFTLGGDCTFSEPNITCTKTNGTAFGTFATQNYATPPAIGGTTPAAGAFTTLSASSTLTTNVTGSTQCLHANSAGVVSGTGSDCGSGSSGLTVGTTTITGGTNGRIEYNNSGVLGELATTGSGNVVLSTSPALTTPNLGTPSAVVLTNASGTAASLTAGLAENLTGSPAITVSSCSGCGSATTFQANGTNLSSSSTVNFENGQGIVVSNPSAGNVQFSSTAPERTVTTSPTVASTDMGGQIVANVSGGGTLTIPAISSTVFASGMTLSVVNYSASTMAVSTTPTVNSGGGCVSGTGIPTGDSWQIVSNGTTLDCFQTTATGGGGSGTVTSVGLSTTASWMTVGGSPVTTSGTITMNPTTGLTANEALMTPNGSSGAVGLRAIAYADLPTIANNTVLGNTSGSTAVPSAQSTLTYLIDTGTKFTLGTGTGACATTTTTHGGAATGEFTCTGTTGASTQVVNLPTSPTGWACTFNDQSTANTLRQSAQSTASATMSGTVTANDVVTFNCVGFGN